jgi:hypothetical protein
VAITGRRRGLFGHRPGRISSQLVEFLSSVVVEAPPPRPLTLAWSSQLCTRWQLQPWSSLFSAICN